jgi:hypothetical protein
MSALAGRRHVSECVRGRWEKLRLATPLSEEHVHEARRRLGCATAGGGAGGRTQKPPPHPAAVWREAVGVAREMELAEEQKEGTRAGQGDGASQRKRRQTKAPKQQRRQTQQGHRYTAVAVALASAEPPRSRYAVDWARLATLVQREARDGERLGAVTVSAARGARLLRCSADVGGALWHGDRVRVVLSSSAAKAGTARPPLMLLAPEEDLLSSSPPASPSSTSAPPSSVAPAPPRVRSSSSSSCCEAEPATCTPMVLSASWKRRRNDERLAIQNSVNIVTVLSQPSRELA